MEIWIKDNWILLILPVIVWLSYLFIKYRHPNFLWVSLALFFVFVATYVPSLTTLMHGLLVVLFFSLCVLTKSKWWLILTIFQLPAFLLNFPGRFPWLPEIIYEDPVHSLLTGLYVIVFGSSLTVILNRTVSGKTQAEDDWIVRWYDRRAMEQKWEHNYGKAIRLFNRAIQLNDENAELYLERGRAYFATGRPFPAFDDYEQAKKLDPNNAFIYYCMAYAYHNMGGPHSALPCINQAVLLEPEDTTYRCERARILESIGHEERALKDYTKVTELDEQYEHAYKKKGDIFYGLKKYDLAIANYSKAISLDPNNSVYYFMRGNVYQVSDHVPKAIEDYNRAIELRQAYECYFHRGIAYMLLDEYTSALEDLNRAIESEKSNAALYNTRACLHLHMQKYESAVEDMNEAIRIDHEGFRELGEQEEIQLGNGEPGTINVDSEEGIKQLLYENLKIAVKLDYAVDDFEKFSLFQPYMKEAPFKELVAAYWEGKERQKDE
ncbi:tetratricopeptide repeat protein [Numidum massiliense]|uniref:tetratricopeptide repeat protein n=1 Tax=Numidum massiliense TaxID=1522315 RepID=UPI0006D54A14|nr:tetratricopeptide repeat protein [Numidum massiliense]